MRRAGALVKAVTRITTGMALALVLIKPSVEIKMEVSVKIEVTVQAQFRLEHAKHGGLLGEEHSDGTQRDGKRRDAGGARVPNNSGR